jgi:hypothetical protein
MRGSVTMLAVLGLLYVLATGTRRLFLSDVKPIADAQAQQTMWVLDAAFLLRALENIAVLGFLVVLIMALAQWMRRPRRPTA